MRGTTRRDLEFLRKIIARDGVEKVCEVFEKIGLLDRQEVNIDRWAKDCLKGVDVLKNLKDYCGN